MEVSSSDEELIHQSTSEFDCCTAGKDREFAEAHPRQQRKNGSRHGRQECTSTPSSSAPKAIQQSASADALSSFLDHLQTSFKSLQFTQVPRVTRVNVTYVCHTYIRNMCVSHDIRDVCVSHM